MNLRCPGAVAFATFALIACHGDGEPSTFFDVDRSGEICTTEQTATFTARIQIIFGEGVGTNGMGRVEVPLASELSNPGATMFLECDSNVVIDPLWDNPYRVGDQAEQILTFSFDNSVVGCTVTIDRTGAPPEAPCLGWEFLAGAKSYHEPVDDVILEFEKAE